ncbi:hypothetical protein ACGFNU_21205 [Spirillospora sp. NPDC048911]|uniref:hypothetical protein n=1 Tax=Spirillospora sp. NPDC048911 TaxID=3364527 RepID=UPI003717957F
MAIAWDSSYLTVRPGRYGRGHSPPLLPGSVTAESTPPIISLDDIHARFGALSERPEPERTLRGLTLALAEYYLVKLPDEPAKAKAIEALEDAMDFACEALTGAC